MFAATSGLLISNHLQPPQPLNSRSPSIAVTGSPIHPPATSIDAPSCRIAPYISVPPIHHRLNPTSLISFINTDHPSEVGCNGSSGSMPFTPPTFDSAFLNAAHQVDPLLFYYLLKRDLNFKYASYEIWWETWCRWWYRSFSLSSVELLSVTIN